MKHKNIIVSAVMCLFLLIMSAFAWFKPADDFSAAERRRLARLPELSLKTVLSGKYMSDFEKYSLDQFPMRDEFRSLKAVTALNIFQRAANNDIFLADGWACKIEYPENTASLQRAAERFSYVYDKYLKDSGTVNYVSVIPDKNYFIAAEKGYPAIDYEKFCTDFLAELDYMEYIDIFPELELADYYKTDTHWRQEKILDAAEKLSSAMGAPLEAEFEERTLDSDFFGVYYGQSALPLPGEKLSYLVNDDILDAQVFDYQNSREISVYDMEKAAGRDPYEMFLSGPLSLLSIENENASTDKELIIFRDSFGSSIAPLLIPAYEKITLVDIRYMHPDMLGKYIDFDGQDVLFLYSVPVLNNSETIK